MKYRVQTIKMKLIILFIIIVSVILLLLIGMSKYLINTTIIEKSNQYYNDTFIQIGKKVDLQINQCEEMSLALVHNQVIKNYLRELIHNKINYHIAKYQIIREILRHANLNIINNIYIFTEDYPVMNCYYSTPILDGDEVSYETYNNDLVSAEKIIWSELQSDPFQISVLCSIATGEEALGLLKIDFMKTFISHIIEDSIIGKEGEVYLVDHNDNIIYSNNTHVITQSFNTIEKVPGSIVKYDLDNKNWTLVGIIPESEIVSQITQFNHVFFTMIVLVLLCIMVFAIMAAKSILFPLKQIMKGMESIQKGDLSITLDYKRHDEFSIIIKNFNYMVKKIKSLIDTVYHQQVNYRKSEMVALQAKLNPHFLYNTMDMIYWMCIAKEQDDIGEIIVSLSNILRYSISHENEFVTIREDFDQINNYLKIQKMRFEDKLHYDFIVDDAILEFKIPKLLIQPLVENSIKHGFKELDRIGIISIKGYSQKNNLIFEVEDNGHGMSKEKINDILRKTNSDEKKLGVGIRLVHDRIHYTYGEDYGISIESSEDKGTKIMIKLRKKTQLYLD